MSDVVLYYVENYWVYKYVMQLLKNMFATSFLAMVFPC